MKKILLLSILLWTGWVSAQAIDLDKENRDPKYVESIVSRSQKIVDKLGINDAKVAEDVRNVIANRYFTLNDIYETRDAKVKEIKESDLVGEAKNNALKAAEDAKDAALYRIHFAFPADSIILSRIIQLSSFEGNGLFSFLPISWVLLNTPL